MRFGIIGTNWITDKLIDAGKEIKDFKLTAVYSRTEETAKKFAQKYGVDTIFTNLDKMAESDKIDGVYIASPNSFHSSQSILFLKNRKAVLCEKPATSNLKELEEVIKTAEENNTLYMEAMKIPFIPTYNVLKENLHKVGKIRKMVTGYCQHSSRYEDYKKGDVKNAFKPEFSNGALMDIGIYPLFLAVSLFGSPEKLYADGLILENGKGIDAQGIINMSYIDMDITVLFSKITNSYVPTEIMGEDGSLLIEHPSEMSELYFIDRKNNNKKTELTLPGQENSMYYELKHFIDLYNEGKTESPINNFHLMKKVMKIMDEARKKIGIIFPADKVK
ncbi:gfo/Idh/MocA family oxidoreductase [Leptotrichia sp. OH3620_COT-345]|uniref:Gfo/Idh/MocA family protein n=1 Tax=Leptotrichia sp. OH3620_COT-345 TaxID=2491048 RepID=UPI000F64690A|nr:Gfo/Idh/MocA family oxidoreductase [Leptotrichia sp. OH3620_COT-345]RRD40929.1 gfo/Idh/MocA family oxidoreductase [Leptotrichia sp. OH3620_COT-345]